MIVLVGLSFITVDRNYFLFAPKTTALVPQINDFEIRQSFDIGNDKLILFGNATTSKKGVGLVLYDSKSKQTIFKDMRTGDEDFLKPHFFKTSAQTDPIIILCTTGADYTYGVYIYTLTKSEMKNIGYMDVALNEDPNSSSTDPGPWTLITNNDGQITFSFSKPVSTDFQGDKQKNYKAGELTYEYRDGKLTMRTK
jgi:hypothetical protein